jgi:hypothetical protein
MQRLQGNHRIVSVIHLDFHCHLAAPDRRSDQTDIEAEAEAFGIVEPFYGAGLSSHYSVLKVAWVKYPGGTLDQAGGINGGNQTGPPKAKRERKTNNNLMQCGIQDTVLLPICLFISDFILLLSDLFRPVPYCPVKNIP